LLFFSHSCCICRRYNTHWIRTCGMFTMNVKHTDRVARYSVLSCVFLCQKTALSILFSNTPTKCSFLNTLRTVRVI